MKPIIPELLQIFECDYLKVPMSEQEDKISDEFNERHEALLKTLPEAYKSDYE